MANLMQKQGASVTDSATFKTTHVTISDEYMTREEALDRWINEVAKYSHAKQSSSRSATLCHL